MLESLPASEGNLVCFRAVGTLTEEDYTDIFIPVMTDVLTRFEVFRLYCDETSSWETGEVLHSNLHKFERAAVVGGPSWAGLALVLRDSLPRGAYEFFTDGNQKRALAWVKT